jgi:N-acetylglucosaminyldiphosphoundecaprenol N-acetyl-beta-D-mannosaminyltransferase
MTQATPDIAAPPRADVLGCQIDRLDTEDSIARCIAAIDTRTFLAHMSINVAKLVTLREDSELRRIVAGCGLINADGQGVVWASRLLGDPLPERVAGIDLMLRLLAEAERRGYRVYILGARQSVLEQAVQRLRALHPDLVIAGYRDGYFTDDEAQGVADAIRAAKPDILLLAMSSPRKEYFLGRYCPQLGVPFAMGVGGAIDVVAGITRRAPHRWQRLGLEWLYRLLQEPARMLPRYARTNSRFVAILASELARRGGRRWAGAR